MTPRQARRQRTSDWNKAIAEGRVVRYTWLEGPAMRSFTTPQRATEFIQELRAGGFKAELVDPALADRTRIIT